MDSMVSSVVGDFEDPFVQLVTIQTIHRAAMDRANDADRLFRQCDSPIEKMLLASVLVLSQEFGYDFIDFYYDIPHKKLHSPCDLGIECQFEVGKFKIDFCFTKKEYDSRVPNQMKTTSVLVECDGHDFHERTKEQARRDRSRDRKLQLLGYSILRFTGSEIWADPYKCAKEIFAFLNTKGKQNG
jgi:very-short-patch-repair endonuclease